MKKYYLGLFLLILIFAFYSPVFSKELKTKPKISTKSKKTKKTKNKKTKNKIKSEEENFWEVMDLLNYYDEIQNLNSLDSLLLEY